MAKFGIEQTSMNAPGLGGASFIAQGVEDRSGELAIKATTGLISNVGTTAVEAYKGKQIADVEADVERTAINEYMNRRSNVDIAQGAALEIEGIELGKENLFKSGADEAQMGLMEQQLNNAYSRYGKALKQGVMSPEEFHTRVTAALRSAVNKNPGLYPELSAHTAKVLELSGIQDVVKADALMKQSQQAESDKYLNRLYGRMEKAGLSYTSRTPVYEMEQQLQVYEGDELNFNLLKRSNERRELFTKEEGRKWIASGNFDSAVRGGVTEFGKNIFAIIDQNNITPETYQKFKPQIHANAQSMKAAMLQSIPPEFRNDPVVLQGIDSYNKSIDDTLKVAEEVGSGEDLKKVLQNQLDVTKIRNEQVVQGQYNVPAIELGMKMAQSMPGIFTGVDSTFRKSVIETGTALASGNFQAPLIDKQMPRDVNDNRLSQHITNAASLGSKEKDFTALNKVLDSFNNKTPLIKDENEKFLFLNKNLEALSKSDLTGASVDTVAKVKTMVTSYMENPQYGVKSMLANVEKYNATLDILPDGRIMFTGDKAQAFNEKFGNAINQALGAYANAHNLSTKEAANKFYPEYFGGVVETPPKPSFERVSPQEVAGTIKSKRPE